MSKCNTCKVMADIYNSKDPACCAWFMDNVVLGNKSVDDCPKYKSVILAARHDSKPITATNKILDEILKGETE